MISDDDRAKLGELAMRAIDTIIEEYGDDAHLVTATLVYEVKVNEGEDTVWHGSYESIKDTSPHHVAGLLRTTADYISAPDPE